MVWDNLTKEQAQRAYNLVYEQAHEYLMKQVEERMQELMSIIPEQFRKHYRIEMEKLENLEERRVNVEAKFFDSKEGLISNASHFEKVRFELKEIKFICSLKPLTEFIDERRRVK
jgi:hypothetical protein